MKVKVVRPAGVANVYNMEVANTHDFAVNGGVIVHNCYDELRYVCMKNPISPRPKVVPSLVEYDPLDLAKEQKHVGRYDFYARY